MFLHRVLPVGSLAAIALACVAVLLPNTPAIAQITVLSDDYESYTPNTPNTPVAPYDFGGSANISAQVIPGVGVGGTNAMRLRYDVAETVTHNTGLRYNLPTNGLNTSSNLASYTLSFDLALGAGSTTTGFFQNRLEMFVNGTTPAQQQGWAIDYSLLTPGTVDADTPGAYQHYSFTLDSGPPIFAGNVQVDPTSPNFDFAFVFLAFPSAVTATNTVFLDNLKIEVVPPPSVDLTLVVNKSTEEVRIRNESAGPVSFDYYKIESATNALNPAGWNSLDDQGIGTLPTDFDGNGSVGGSDLSVWQASYGVDNGADADGDGDSDGRDFLAWQRTFGQVPGPADTWIEAGGSSTSTIGELLLNGATTLNPGQELSLGAAYDNSIFGAANGDLMFSVSTGESTALGIGQVEYVTSFGAVAAVPEPMSVMLGLVGLVILVGKRL
jgi:hypothetical protein